MILMLAPVPLYDFNAGACSFSWGDFSCGRLYVGVKCEGKQCLDCQ
jgi:hypothetical protein